ncbi:uncharacterized protein DS421_14g459870 [Arachis hypogaea]|nr:uncharacterized protein DS421_14g459870 [Arachis hypogaea]
MPGDSSSSSSQRFPLPSSLVFQNNHRCQGRWICRGGSASSKCVVYFHSVKKLIKHEINPLKLRQ